MTNILRIDSSARHADSVSRKLADHYIARYADATVTTRDLAAGLPQLDETWVGATFTPPEARSDAQKEALALSDELLAEVQAADVIVISAATYNFFMPSTLKAWLDQLARVGVAFQYGEDGNPVGLLDDKPVIYVSASGGTPVGAPHEFASPYLKFMLGFMGLTNVTAIGAATAVDPDAIDKAKEELSALPI